MNTVVLGGAGFIGSALAARLLAEGHDVTIVDNFSRGQRAHIPLGCRIETCDVRDWWSAEPSWDWLFCLAGVVGVPNVERDPLLAWRINTWAVEAVLRCRADIGKIFYASTSEAYGTPTEIPTPETAPLQVPSPTSPRGVYAASKIWGEVGIVHSGRPYVIGRFHNIYGPRMGADHVIPKFCLRVHGREPLIVDDPTAVRAFCYIDDAVEALIRLMQDTTNVTVNIGNPTEPVTMLALMERIQAVAGGAPQPIQTGTQEGFPRRRTPDIRRLTALTGFVPKVSLDEGLRRTYAWYAR